MHLHTMAAPGDAPVARRIYSFVKTATEEVRADLAFHNGDQFANVRVWFKTRDGSWAPTKKGVTIHTSLLPELRAAVDALEEAVGTPAVPA